MISILSESPDGLPRSGAFREQKMRKRPGVTTAAFCVRRSDARLPRNWNMDNEFKTWMCLICGWVYDEAAGAPDEGIAPGTRWADVPMNWTCPECGARKEDFEMVQV
jgi:rubredoxin